MKSNPIIMRAGRACGILTIVSLVAIVALSIIHDIEAELDHQERACKAPAVVVRRTK